MRAGSDVYQPGNGTDAGAAPCRRHLPDISLTEATSITFSDGNLVVGNYSCPTADIVNITYQPNPLPGDLNGDNTVDVGDIMTIINIMTGGTKPVETAYLSCPDDKHPHMIDLGLPSGTKWACCNVGASAPEDYGDYFAWGETQPKDRYTWPTYQYFSSGFIGGSDIAGTQYDAATANWGSPWQMPSFDQIKELLNENNCTSTWTTQNGVDGQKFTGKNGGTIFLPAAGSRLKNNLEFEGACGEYWSSTRYESSSNNSASVDVNNSAYRMYFIPGGAYWGGYQSYLFYGLTVRPVR